MTMFVSGCSKQKIKHEISVLDLGQSNVNWKKWLEYHPLVKNYARGDIGLQFAETY